MPVKTQLVLTTDCQEAEYVIRKQEYQLPSNIIPTSSII